MAMDRTGMAFNSIRSTCLLSCFYISSHLELADESWLGSSGCLLSICSATNKSRSEARTHVYLRLQWKPVREYKYRGRDYSFY